MSDQAIKESLELDIGNLSVKARPGRKSGQVFSHELEILLDGQPVHGLMKMTIEFTIDKPVKVTTEWFPGQSPRKSVNEAAASLREVMSAQSKAWFAVGTGPDYLARPAIYVYFDQIQPLALVKWDGYPIVYRGEVSARIG